jgi:hypothetical protein
MKIIIYIAIIILTFIECSNLKTNTDNSFEYKTELKSHTNSELTFSAENSVDKVEEAKVMEVVIKSRPIKVESNLVIILCIN